MQIVKLYKQKVIYKKGDSLRIKPGVEDYITEFNIGGLEGRIINILDEDEFDTLYEIELDSISLKMLSKEQIKKSISKGGIFFYVEANHSEVEAAVPRDSREDVEKMQNLLMDVYDCHELKDDKDYWADDDVAGDAEGCEKNSNDNSLPDDINYDECEQCPEKEHCKSMQLSCGFIEQFLFADNSDQIYSLDVQCSDIEKMFCAIPIKEWKCGCKEFKKGYALN